MARNCLLVTWTFSVIESQIKILYQSKGHLELSEEQSHVIYRTNIDAHFFIFK